MREKTSTFCRKTSQKNNTRIQILRVKTNTEEKKKLKSHLIVKSALKVKRHKILIKALQ